MNCGSPPDAVALLICFAVKEEAAFFTPQRIAGGSRVLITGMGRRNTSTRLQQTLRTLRPERVITCGFAGALDPQLKVGDLLFDADFDSGLADLFTRHGARTATFHCSTRVAVSVEEKKELRRTTGCDAVEMESAVIRTVCRDAAIPSATLRAVSDTAAEDMPLDFNALLTADQKISIPRLALALMKSPRSVPRLMELQRNTRLAARRLADALNGVLGSLRSAGV
ncbi:MAG TPA: hypothetical protein VEH04_18890 [Verrucomicrobiae bacterium]|nr:hypothetical protein [Verrucomicrobiae bacterium]